MNRKERRIQKKKHRKIPFHLQDDFLRVEVPADAGLKDGEKFTVKGHRRMKDGSIEKNCREGEESVFTAVVKESWKPQEK